MWLSNLKLHNFRNYLKNEFSFNNKKVIITGENASGKTSILEAIYLLCFGKSFRAKKDVNLINLNNSEAYLSGEFHTQTESDLNISINIGLKKNIKINNKSIDRFSRLIGSVNTILFSERDIDLIERSPDLRRRFIDIIFSQIDQSYLTHLIKYQKILEQRNYCLRNDENDENLIVSLNRNLIEHGAEIVYLRMKYLKDVFTLIYNVISQYNISCLKDLYIEYSTNVINSQEEDALDIEGTRSLFNQKLMDAHKKELDLRFTFIGPHRDDIIFCRNEGHGFLEYSSTGERRLLSVILKITESGFLFENTKDLPIILLDDILLELDKKNSELIMNYINSSENQFFIATTDENEYNKITDIDLVKL